MYDAPDMHFKWMVNWSDIARVKIKKLTCWSVQIQQNAITIAKTGGYECRAKHIDKHYRIVCDHEQSTYNNLKRIIISYSNLISWSKLFRR